jgi:hypothetical protein
MAAETKPRAAALRRRRWLMPNIVQHPKTHVRFVRIVIPKDARHAFDGRGEKWVSLHTRDDAVANQRGVPVIASIKRKIEDARAANCYQRREFALKPAV